jgi:lipoprotein NlpI
MLDPNEPPYLPGRPVPSLLDRLYMWLILLFVVFVMVPFGAYIVYEETIGAWLNKPHARQAQQLRELGEKADELRKAGKYDEAIELWTQVVESKARQSDALFASAYASRGICYAYKGDQDRSIKDYSKSIELNPEWKLTYNLRGVAFAEKGEYDRAIADQTKALELTPRDFSSLDARALDYYLKGDYAEAARDWRAALRYCNERDKTPYLHLWSFVASTRSGSEGGKDLATFLNSRRRSSRQWPMPVVRMLLGEISADDLLRSASQGNEALQHKCEAHFYIAHRYLMSHDKGGAKTHFQRCLDTRAADYSEYMAAKVDIARIGR